jgi:hypothetical protein
MDEAPGPALGNDQEPAVHHPRLWLGRTRAVTSLPGTSEEPLPLPYRQQGSEVG